MLYEVITTEGRQGDIGTGHRVDATVLAELTFAGTENDSSGQCRPAAHGVHQGRTGKVNEALLRKPASTPGPRPLYRIDYTGQNYTDRITSYNVCYTKLLRLPDGFLRGGLLGCFRLRC